jgi:formate hydrogenlyase subunit 6/NADH:ubiquinone oxidoreductase subunit I
MNKVNINNAWCKQCGICVEFCPAESIHSQEIGECPVPTYQDKVYRL